MSLSLGSSKGSKKHPTDLIRAHSKETPSGTHGSVKSYHTVGHELRNGPQLKPKRLRIHFPGSHLDNSGRRDGAPPRRLQPPARAEESSAEQLISRAAQNRQCVQFERPAATSTDPEKRSCSTANLALRQKKHTSSLLVFATGFFLKCGLKQHALYTSSS